MTSRISQLAIIDMLFLGIASLDIKDVEESGSSFSFKINGSQLLLVRQIILKNVNLRLKFLQNM